MKSVDSKFNIKCLLCVLVMQCAVHICFVHDLRHSIWPSYEPSFHFADRRSSEYVQNYTNLTRLIIERNGLSVSNLHVYDFMDMEEEILDTGHRHGIVLGRWQKQIVDSITHIHVHENIRSQNARISVLAHEIAHEYHFQCDGTFGFLQREWKHQNTKGFDKPAYLKRLEDYTDRLAQFLLAKTCIIDPSVMRLGMYKIGLGKDTHKDMVMLRSEKWARVYRDIHCRAELPQNVFDPTLCAHEDHASIWVGRF